MHARACWAFLKADPCLPAHIRQPTDIHQLAHRAVRFRGIGGDPAFETRQLCHQLRQLEDREVGAGADVDMAQHRFGVGVVGRLVEVHHEKRGLGHVIDMQELAPRLARAPDHHFLAAVLGRFVEAADQGREDMADLLLEISFR